MSPPAPANIRVLVRVRPLNESERTERGTIGRTNVLNIDTSASSSIDFSGEDNKENGAVISVNNIVDSNRRVTSGDYRAGYTSDGEMNGGCTKQYVFDAVHGERSTQSEVYESIKGIVDAVVDGYNGTIVAYGQTGSGKTHTVFGSGIQGDEAGAGLIQRSLRDIFNKITSSMADGLAREDSEYPQVSNSNTTFKGTFFEIFNERVYDLLSADSLEKSLAVREDRNGVYVEGLTEIEVRNTKDAEDLLTKGLANRHVASTNMNRTSSRSHAIFVLSVKTEQTTSDGLRKVRHSKFTLVDLAGSERQKSTATVGNRLKEASMINKSLLCLGHVINALVDKEHGRERHVPFRNSKLTFLLKDTWGGNSKTCIVATVSPSGASQGETISTLTFAQRAKLIKNTAILNEDTCGTVAALQAEVAKLKSKLEKSYLEPDKFIVDNVDGNENEVIVSLKRLNKKAEARIAELEKMISDESEKTHSLKRKLQEETMARKFKERRLDSLLHKDGTKGNDSQVAVLKDEIASLQRRLQAPSEDAIEWRVAYEEAKEALDKMIDEGDLDISSLEKKNSELEETVDRLCAEKLHLDERVKELTESSVETRKEIESIMDEVDKLERDMVCCQERLRQRETESKDFESRAITAESKLQELMDLSEKLTTENLILTEKTSEMQEKLNEKSQILSDLMTTVEKKNAELKELESLIEENGKELQLTAESLKQELTESKATLTSKDKIIEDINQCLVDKSEENVKLKEQLQETLSEFNCQRESILALEQKISFVTQEKNDAIEVMKKEFQCKESEMLEQIRSLQNKLDDIAVEKANIEARLSCAKQQSEISSEKLNLKEITIKEYEAELSRVSAEFRDAEEALKTKLSAVEHNLKKANSRIGLLTSKLSQAEEDKIAFLVERENEKSQMEYNLGNEIDGLKAAIAWANSEQEKLREQLLSSQDQTKQLQENLETVKNAAASKDDEIKALLEEKERNAKSSKIESDESDLEMRSKITSLEVERDELLEEVFIIYEELRDVVNENLDLENLLRESKAEIVRLAADFDALIEKNKCAMSKEQHEKEHQMQELNYYKDLCADCQNTIEKNNQELSDMRSQCSMLQDQLTDARQKLQQTIDGQQELKRSYHDSCEKLRAQEASFQNVQNELEEKVRSYEQEVSKLKEISESYCMQLADLQMIHQKSEEDNAENLAKLAEASSQMLHLKDRFDAQLAEKEEELGVLDLKVKSLECDCLSLRKQNKVMASTEVEMQEKYNNLKDRQVLLEREKGNLEFEIDTMQADHDALGDQVRLLSERVSMLEDENKRLKIFVENMKCGDSHGDLSEIVSSSGSTWNSDSRLSYDTLATNMDSLIKKMSTGKSQSNLNPQETVEDVENVNSANECLDNSFDESMFLPNSEDQLEIGGNTGHLPPNTLVTSDKAPLEVYRETDENQGRKACVTFSTPRKGKDDYGNRRVPLSDKKNQTPLTNQSKRLRSSAKKVMSTSKKSRTKYLLIDNKQLFN